LNPYNSQGYLISNVYKQYRRTILSIAAINVSIAASTVLYLNLSYAYLATNIESKIDTVVVEGWVPDFAIEAIVRHSKINSQTKIVTTGSELPSGFYLSEYKTYSILAKHTAIKLGHPEAQIIALHCGNSPRNRTLQNAIAFKDWLAENPDTTSACLVSLGPHTRRSYNTYKSVLPEDFELGCIAIEPRDYDPDEWWKTSAGFKTVTYESIAYLYSLFAL
jgi:hypothetical protein